ncbi:MAG TPA: amidohydrolase family protein, partial [Rhizobiaceae bacterium]|nr:amidohydrolase family protein [Rhizobiaceae bacterium]
MKKQRIIDVHAHIGRTMTNGVGQDVETWLAGMDVSGIDQAIISVAAGGIQAEGLADTRRANDIIASAVRDHPERFPVGLASIEVRHGEAGIGEVQRALEAGLKGLVFHAAFEGFGLDSTVFLNLLKALGEKPALVLIHATTDGKSNPTAIGRVAQMFPHLFFIAGHPVFTEEQRAQCVSAVHANGNLNLDLSYQADPAITTYFVQEVGAPRILFGSDAPYFEPSQVIESIEAATISERDRKHI